MSEYKKALGDSLYFVTMTIEGWVNVFDRKVYKDIIVKNLQYCQDKENLELYAYVIMSNHLHLVAARDSEKGLTELLGRFKSVTAKNILKEIETNPQESRREWLLYLFEYFAKKNNQYSKYHLWQYTNNPVFLYNHEVTVQKVKYIHQNPVRAGWVADESQYIYSSACADSPIKVLSL